MRRCNWIINTLIKAISGRSSYSYTQTSASAQYDLIMIEDSTTTTTTPPPPSPNNIWPLFCQVQLMCVCSFLRLAVVSVIIEILPLMKINLTLSWIFSEKEYWLPAGWLASFSRSCQSSWHSHDKSWVFEEKNNLTLFFYNISTNRNMSKEIILIYIGTSLWLIFRTNSYVKKQVSAKKDYVPDI